VWSANGRELFYGDFTDDFFVCPVTTKGTEVVVGKPEHLFHASTPGIGLSFDVSLDGEAPLGESCRSRSASRSIWS